MFLILLRFSPWAVAAALRTADCRPPWAVTAVAAVGRRQASLCSPPRLTAASLGRTRARIRLTGDRCVTGGAEIARCRSGARRPSCPRRPRSRRRDGQRSDGDRLARTEGEIVQEKRGCRTEEREGLSLLPHRWRALRGEGREGQSCHVNRKKVETCRLVILSELSSEIMPSNLIIRKLLCSILSR